VRWMTCRGTSAWPHQALQLPARTAQRRRALACRIKGSLRTSTRTDIGAYLIFRVSAPTNARRRRRRRKVGRVLVHNNPTVSQGRRAIAEEEEIQRRSSACSQYPPYQSTPELQAHGGRGGQRGVPVPHRGVGPGGCCSPRHRMPFSSISEDSQCVV